MLGGVAYNVVWRKAVSTTADIRLLVSCSLVCVCVCVKLYICVGTFIRHFHSAILRASSVQSTNFLAKFLRESRRTCTGNRTRAETSSPASKWTITSTRSFVRDQFYRLVRKRETTGQSPRPKFTLPVAILMRGSECSNGHARAREIMDFFRARRTRAARMTPGQRIRSTSTSCALFRRGAVALKSPPESDRRRRRRRRGRVR